MGWGLPRERPGRLKPYVSVHADGRVAIAKAFVLLADAMLDAGADRALTTKEGAQLVVDITAKVTLPNARALHHAVVRIDPGNDDGRPNLILAWEYGSD